MPPSKKFDLVSWSGKCRFFDSADELLRNVPTPATTSKSPEVNSVSEKSNSMVKDVACQVPEVSAPDCRQILSPARVDESFFVCGHESLKVLFYEISRGCLCGKIFLWPEVVTMDGHVLRLDFECSNGHRIKWSSSSILNMKYTANCRYVIAFL